MLVVAVWRHPTAISIAWSGLQLVAQGGMPRDLDSLVAEVKTLLCLPGGSSLLPRLAGEAEQALVDACSCVEHG